MATADNGRLRIEARVDTEKLRTDAAEATQILHGIGNSAIREGDAIDKSMKKIGATIAGAFAVSQLKDFVMQVAKVRGEFQQLEIAFSTMLQSKSKADDLMNQLIQTAATTPFNMSDIANAAKQLLAYGVEGEKVNETLIRLGDIAAGLSIPISDLAFLYGTTMVQGRMYTQDLNQFLGRGIPLTAELAKQFGVSQSKVKSLVEEGKVGFPEVEKAIISLTSEGSKFGGLMEKQSQSISGQIANIEDAIEQMFNELGKKSEGVISGTLSAISGVIEHWESIGKVILTVVATYGAYKAAVLAVAAANKIAAIMGEVQAFISLIKYVQSAKDAMLLFNTVCSANPLGLVISLLAAAAAAFGLFNSNASEAAEMTQKYGESAATTLSRIDTLTTTLKGLTKGSTTYKQVMDDLNSILEEWGISAIKEGDSIDTINTKRAQAIELIKEEAAARQYANAMAQGDADYAKALADAQSQLLEDLKGAETGKFVLGMAWTTDNDELQSNAEAITRIIGEVVQDKISLIANKTGEEYQKGINTIYATIEDRMRQIGISEETIAKAWMDDGFFYQSNIIGKYINSIQEAAEAHDRFSNSMTSVFEAAKQASNSTMSFEEKVAAIASRIRGADDDVHGLYKSIQKLMSQYSENTVGFTIKFRAEIPAWMYNKDIPRLKQLAEWFTSHGAALQDGKTLKIGNKIWTKQQLLQRGADYAQAAEYKQTQKDNAQKDAEANGKENKSRRRAAAQEAQRRREEAAREAQQQADQKADRLRQIEDYTQSVNEAVEASELDIRQKRIELQEEGFERELAQLQLNYDKLVKENQRREREMLNSLADKKLLEWLNQNPKATKTEQEAFRDSLLDENSSTRLTSADLTEGQRKQLKAYAEFAEEYLTESNKRTMSKILSDVLTYEEQRQKITEEYARKRNSLYEQEEYKDDEGNIKRRFKKDKNGNRILRNGVSEGNVAELDRQEQDALSAIDEQFASREAEYKVWCDYIAGQTLEQLQSMLYKAKAELDALEKQGADSSALAVARAKVNKLENDVKSGNAKKKFAPEKRTLKEWQDLYSTLNECAGAFDKIGDAVGGAAGEIIKVSGQIATSTLSMINGIVTLANSSGQAMAGTATAASTAMQAVEKASVILAVVSAALQVATAIANLFNKDEDKQEEIERLQERIDQLQWELDNADLLRLNQQYESSAERVRKAIFNTRLEMAQLAIATADWNSLMIACYGKLSSNTILMKKTVKALADQYEKMSYTADKALGDARYDDYYSQLENISQQQILITEQIAKEQDKKKTNKGKISEWQRKIEELGHQAAMLINDLMEDIIGGSAEQISEQLSDAFFDAFANGEDAAVAWGNKVKEIASDIVKRMLVQKLLEPEIGKIFDKYKAQWFKNGKFVGAEEVKNSMGNFMADLMATQNVMTQIWDSIPKELKDFLTDNAEREGVKKGIATASQDSVDELNARATTIQSHTYSISENTKILVANTTAILSFVTAIEAHTEAMSSRMETMERNILSINSTLEDFNTQGLKLK